VEERADKKVTKIRKVEGAWPQLPMHLDERTDHLLGSIPIPSDLLIFLFHPLHLGRRTPAALAQASRNPSLSRNRCTSRLRIKPTSDT
jgi:hypothetical protein